MKKHAKFSASSSDRWMSCPGSIALIAKAPPEPESEYAAEGTLAHEVLEKFLTSKRPYSESFLLKGKYPEEMIEYAFQAFKEIEARKPKHAVLLAETKCDLSFLYPDTFGTADAVIVEDFGTLHVIDYKYGGGVIVSPIENSQLIFYALGVAHLYDYNFQEVNLIIIQPRAGHEVVREWPISINDLMSWRDKFTDGIKAALKPDAPLASGSWCKFCPASSICPEISKGALAQAQIDFDPIGDEMVAPEIQDLSGEVLGQTLMAVQKLEIWIKALRAHAFESLKRGEKVPGFKLVPRRATRKWLDMAKVEKLAQKEFGEMVYQKKLLTPAQFEKKVDKEFVAKWAQSISSGVTLASESDARSEADQIESEFDEIADL